MLYNISEIKETLKNLVGLRPSVDPTIVIPNELQTTSTGQYFNAVHPILSSELIYKTALNTAFLNVGDWSNLATYNAGDVKRYNNILYKSLQDANTGNTPEIGVWWEEYNMFQIWFENLKESSINNAISILFNKRGSTGNIKNVLENKQLWNNTVNVRASNNSETISDKLSGFRFTPASSKSLMLSISDIGFAFTEEQTNLELIFWHSSSPDPIHTETIPTIPARQMYWHSVTPILLQLSTNNYEGSFYITYDQTAINGQPIAINRDWGKGPCRSCGGGVYRDYNLYSPYFRVASIEVPKATDDKFFDLNNVSETPTNSNGLNFRFTVGCDFTETIKLNSDIFANLIKYEVGIALIKAIALNVNASVNQQQSAISSTLRSELLFSVSGNDTRKGDIQTIYENLRDLSELDLQRIDNVCMPCNKPNAWKRRRP